MKRNSTGSNNPVLQPASQLRGLATTAIALVLLAGTPVFGQPGDFHLLLPAHDAVEQPLTGIQFDWEDAADVETYSLYLSTDNTFPPAEPPYVSGLIASSFPYTGRLAAGTDFYWNVVAKNTGGETWSLNGNFHFQTWSPDVGITAIVDPEVEVQAGTISPKITVVNAGNSLDPCSLFCDIERPGGGFYEQFLANTFPPVGWAEAHPLPDVGDYNWRLDDANDYAECLREASLLNNNDWLITEKVRVRAADTLYFWYKALGTGTYPESLEVWVSYTDANPASFVDCIQAFDFTSTTFQPAWADFHSVGDAEVYIAFRYGMSPLMMGTGVALDNIQLKTVYYSDTAAVDLLPGASADVTFGAWNAKEGHYLMLARAIQTGDVNPDNDKQSRDFVVTPQVLPPSDWTEMTPMPAEPSLAAVKDGGTLAWMPDKGLIFAAKGAKTRDFYYYNRAANAWVTQPLVPEGGGKGLKKGARAVADAGRYVYLTKGNNTREFYRFDSDSSRWETLDTVPPGIRGRRVKGGTDMVYVPMPGGDRIYLLKGYDTEFYRYDVTTGHWTAKDEVPFYGRPKYMEGSFLAYDGNRTIYCHQSKYAIGMNHAMFKFDIVGDTWYSETLVGMPLNGKHRGAIKTRKSKDGGCADWYDGKLYALKGAATGQFYRYDPNSDTAWLELDTMPCWGNAQKRRYVKTGADMVNALNGFYALKGNKTRELWRYVVSGAQAQAQAQARDGVTSGVERTAYGIMRVEPNPLSSGWATLSYSLPKAGPVNVTVLDVVGRTVLRQSSIGNLESSMALDLRGLSAGVYLVRLDAEGYTQSQKLVVQR